jgi:hypothetical protein
LKLEELVLELPQEPLVDPGYRYVKLAYYDDPHYPPAAVNWLLSVNLNTNLSTRELTLYTPVLAGTFYTRSGAAVRSYAYLYNGLQPDEVTEYFTPDTRLIPPHDARGRRPHTPPSIHTIHKHQPTHWSGPPGYPS